MSKRTTAKPKAKVKPKPAKRPAKRPAAAKKKPGPKPKPKAEKKEPEDLSKSPIEIWTPKKDKGGQVPPFGRPKTDINLAVVEELAAVGCTLEEIAAACDICAKTLARRRDEEPDIAEALENGRLKGRISLRRAMFKNAMQGNIAAQIFLAKQPQFLAYVDKVDHDVNGGEPIKHIIEWKVIPAELIRQQSPPPDPKDGEDEE